MVLGKGGEKVGTEVGTEVGTLQNPLPVTISDNPFPPVPTFSPNNSQNTGSATVPGETNNSQSEKSFENRGGNIPPNNIQNPSQQGIESVPTSVPTSKTPQCPETNANRYHAAKLADQVREAIANGDSDEAQEIWRKFENIPLSQRGQQRAFFWKNLEQTNEKRKASLLIFTNLQEGEKVKYVGTTEQYKGLELLAYDAISHNGVTFACLMPDGHLTTWLKPEELRKL